MMKKILILLTLALPGFAFAGGPSILSSIVPQYIQGSTPTNNNRVPYWFWGQINGLTPGATYHYYVAIDTIAASPTSNGAGLPYLINPVTRTVRRILNPAMTANTGFDSLVANNVGVIEGWFGIEPTANARFVPGATVYPKIMLNNGAGGTVVAWRLLFSSPVTVISFGTTSMSATQGSALYDSLDAAPKNFICAYDNILATGRPLGAAIVENDSLYLSTVSSIANFYQQRVDSLNFHWGIIVPNNLPNGIRALEERSFGTATPVDTVIDLDGIWCYGTNTVNMSNGLQALYLNSTFALTSSAAIPDTTWTGIPTTFTVTSNSPNSTYTWNYGDLGTGTGASTMHTYIAPGVFNVQVIVSTGGCSDTINQTIVVELSTGIITPMPLSFQVMPNPTNGELFISTKDQHEKMITVTDLLGQIIYSEMLTGNKISIDITGQTHGIYLVEVRDMVTGKSGVKKIVLQ
jgi:PKD repeat protein